MPCAQPQMIAIGCAPLPRGGGRHWSWRESTGVWPKIGALWARRVLVVGMGVWNRGSNLRLHLRVPTSAGCFIKQADGGEGCLGRDSAGWGTSHNHRSPCGKAWRMSHEPTLGRCTPRGSNEAETINYGGPRSGFLQGPRRQSSPCFPGPGAGSRGGVCTVFWVRCPLQETQRTPCEISRTPEFGSQLWARVQV